MKNNSDFKDLLQSLNAAGTRYLIVGGYAVMAHTEPRYTKDLDVWIEPDPENAARTITALAQFGAPLEGVAASDFTESVRIDIMTSVAALEFTSAWDRRVEVDFGGVTAAVLGREDLIRAKRAAGRPQDLLDAGNLSGN